MPSPITMTKHMVEESFQDLRNSFEEYFEKAKAAALNGSKMAKGKFEFKYPGLEWSWKACSDRAKLTIEPVAYTKMILLMFGSDKEIGWHGLIVRDPEDANHFILQDVILFPQEVTSTTVVADEQKYPLWALTLPEEQFQKLRFHGHSHVNMGVTPSSTDTNYYEDNIKQFKDGFYVFMIINKRFDVYIQLYDFDNNTFYDKNEVDIEIGNDFHHMLDAAKKELVTTKTYSYPSYTTPTYQSKVSGQTSLPSHNEKPVIQKGDGKKDEKGKEDDHTSEFDRFLNRYLKEDKDKPRFPYDEDPHPWWYE